jgi:hypothetical protein
VLERADLCFAVFFHWDYTSTLHCLSIKRLYCDAGFTYKLNKIELMHLSGYLPLVSQMTRLEMVNVQDIRGGQFQKCEQEIGITYGS